MQGRVKTKQPLTITITPENKEVNQQMRPLSLGHYTLTVPSEFFDPVHRQLMRLPVVTAEGLICDGFLLLNDLAEDNEIKHSLIFDDVLYQRVREFFQQHLKQYYFEITQSDDLAFKEIQKLTIGYRDQDECIQSFKQRCGEKGIALYGFEILAGNESDKKSDKEKKTEQEKKANTQDEEYSPLAKDYISEDEKEESKQEQKQMSVSADANAGSFWADISNEIALGVFVGVFSPLLTSKLTSYSGRHFQLAYLAGLSTTPIASEVIARLNIQNTSLTPGIRRLVSVSSAASMLTALHIAFTDLFGSLEDLDWQRQCGRHRWRYLDDAVPDHRYQATLLSVLLGTLLLPIIVILIIHLRQMHENRQLNHNRFSFWQRRLTQPALQIQEINDAQADEKKSPAPRSPQKNN